MSKLKLPRGLSETKCSMLIDHVIDTIYDKHRTDEKLIEIADFFDAAFTTDVDTDPDDEYYLDVMLDDMVKRLEALEQNGHFRDHHWYDLFDGFSRFVVKDDSTTR
jgi:hypothetical protein